jgi:hypothetical protein
MWTGSITSTSRERITLTCMTDVFESGDHAGSVLFECSDTEYRACPLCGGLPGVCAGCALPVIRPRHPLDLASSANNLLTLGGGEWTGQVRVTLFGKDAVRPLSTSFAHSCTHSRSTSCESVASALRRLAIQDRVTSTTPSPARAPVPAEEAALHAAIGEGSDTSFDDSALYGSLGLGRNRQPHPAVLLQLQQFQRFQQLQGQHSLPQQLFPAQSNILPMRGDAQALSLDVPRLVPASVPPSEYLPAIALNALPMTEKERRAEERRVKNRLAAARSNQRAREIIENTRNAISSNRARIELLKTRREVLETENAELRRQAATALPSHA